MRSHGEAVEYSHVFVPLMWLSLFKSAVQNVNTLDKSEFNSYFVSFEEHQYWLKEGKKTFFVESGMDLLLLEDSMTAFVDISSDSFYLTCFQNPC